MAIKRINIKGLNDYAKQLKNLTEDDIQRTWSKRELVDLIVYILESLKK